MTKRWMVSAGLMAGAGLLLLWWLMPLSPRPSPPSPESSLEGGPPAASSPAGPPRLPGGRPPGRQPGVSDPMAPGDTGGPAEAAVEAPALPPSAREQEYWKDRERLKRSAPPSQWDRLAEDPDYLAELIDPALADLGLDAESLADPDVLANNPQLLERWIEALVGPAAEMLDAERLDLQDLPPEASQQALEMLEELRETLVRPQVEENGPTPADGEVPSEEP